VSKYNYIISKYRVTVLHCTQKLANRNLATVSDVVELVGQRLKEY